MEPIGAQSSLSSERVFRGTTLVKIGKINAPEFLTYNPSFDTYMHAPSETTDEHEDDGSTYVCWMVVVKRMVDGSYVIQLFLVYVTLAWHRAIEYGHKNGSVYPLDPSVHHAKKS